MKPIDSTPPTNILRNLKWNRNYCLEILDVHTKGRKQSGKHVGWHKQVLGRQDTVFSDGEYRLWVWARGDWQVFVSNRKGIYFEVREGIDPKGARAAWRDYLQTMGVPKR